MGYANIDNHSDSSDCSSTRCFSCTHSCCSMDGLVLGSILNKDWKQKNALITHAHTHTRMHTWAPHNSVFRWRRLWKLKNAHEEYIYIFMCAVCVCVVGFVSALYARSIVPFGVCAHWRMRGERIVIRRWKGTSKALPGSASAARTESTFTNFLCFRVSWHRARNMADKEGRSPELLSLESGGPFSSCVA